MHSKAEIALTIETAHISDCAAIAQIYAHHVLHGTASFEMEPPDEGEIRARMEKVLNAGWPWFVARGAEGEHKGAVLGYAYAAQYHQRPGYRYCCEDSIYLRADMLGQGIGAKLLAELLAASEACGFRQMIAGIAGNQPASITLHSRAGFAEVARLSSVGRKHGQWLDVIYMQRSLGQGDLTPPHE